MKSNKSKIKVKKSSLVSKPTNQNVHWIAHHYDLIKAFARVVFGIFWLSDGIFKFVFDSSSQLIGAISNSAIGQPSFLQPWFSFWLWLVSLSPHLFRISIGGIEILMGIFLILGFLRKPVYVIGLLFSLSLWAVGEGFGGPYGPGVFDIGTGIIYAMVFLSFILLSVIRPTKDFSLDSIICKHFRNWVKYSEF